MHGLYDHDVMRTRQVNQRDAAEAGSRFLPCAIGSDTQSSGQIEYLVIEAGLAPKVAIGI